MKLSQWAKDTGVCYRSAYRMFKNGTLPLPAYQLPTGTIILEETKPPTEAVIYCRVSSYQKKDDLERQVERCKQYCLAKGLQVRTAVKEVASGMNDKRPKLLKMLNAQPAILVVEHKDRLTRFGFSYFEALLPKLGWGLQVIDRDAEERDDLMKDMIAIITSFCCRLYGMRRMKNKVAALKDIVRETGS